MSRIAKILFALSILLSHQAYSQFYQSTNFKEGSGLPSSETYQVYQDTRGFVWVVVGDAAKVKPQLTKLGLPVEEIQPR